ncbi:MAG: inner membrane CreD family protein [Anaerolineae bacterium]|nr:inner membrane CreD family protein [Anaerolineae bacterium]
MTVRRLVAIVIIFVCVTLAWIVLGSSIIARTRFGYDMLDEQVEGLWGAAHKQNAPVVTLSAPGQVDLPGGLESSEIDVDFHLQHRRKGLLWYATYDVAFDGHYTFQNPLDEVVTATVVFEFPSSSAIYDDFEFRVGEVQITPGGNTGRKLTAVIEMAAGEETEIHITYKSRGLDRWLYSFAEGITTAKNFTLKINTDFEEYNFPERSISASTKTRTPEGWNLQWQFENLVTDFDVGVEMPSKLNPGPLASRMSYFAPVSLLFFFTVLMVLGAVNGTNLHPMHYFFLGASFFSFHILFSYLVDHVVLELAFIIAAVVSVALVVSYLWRVIGWRFAVREAGISQLLFLVLFSYAFFFEGYTGLVVTIGAIITLAALMQITAKVDWAAIFSKK